MFLMYFLGKRMESAIEGGLDLPADKLYVLGNSATFMSCDPTFNFGIKNS